MKYKQLSLPIILLLGTILRLANLNQSLWLDEAAQAIESKLPITALWKLDVDFHPPLFHYLLHFWQYLGTNEAVMRLLPVFFGVLTIYFVYLLGKEVFDEKFALVSSLLLASAPYHIYYSQELRNYSLITFLTVVSYHLLIREKWKLFALVTILALYANYFAVFIIFAQGAYLLLFKKERFWQFLKSVILAGLVFSPWLFQMKIQLEKGAVLTSALPEWRSLSAILPAWKVIPETFIKFALGRITFDNKTLYAISTLALFLVYSSLWLFGMSKNKEKSKLFATYLLIPFFFAFFTSLFLPINGPWRLLLILPAFYLLLTLGIHALKGQWQKLALAVVLVVNLFGSTVYFTNQRFQREDWRNAVGYIKNNSTYDSLTLFEFTGPFAPYIWYNNDDKNALGAFEALSATKKNVDRQLSKVTPGKTKIFLFQYLQELTDPDKIAYKWLSDNGYKEVDIVNFNGVGFISTLEK